MFKNPDFNESILFVFAFHQEKKCSKYGISQLIKYKNITKQELRCDCKVLPPLEVIQHKSNSTGSAGLMVPLALLLDSVQPTFRRPPLYPIVSVGHQGGNSLLDKNNFIFGLFPYKRVFNAPSLLGMLFNVLYCPYFRLIYLSALPEARVSIICT